ncbi:hypothetical protein C476_14319 [Natrinema limicola JCM 13563]|uniref:Uncharacterized protein n=1 Tax=Natrinema limicola JCM 13563 TaxID=1230457 RepID=M0C4D5_9EURY|nr:hypothetical protein C476_14319 [Natrinema limicola JCM 13563]
MKRLRSNRDRRVKNSWENDGDSGTGTDRRPLVLPDKTVHPSIAPTTLLPTATAIETRSSIH